MLLKIYAFKEMSTSFRAPCIPDSVEEGEFTHFGADWNNSSTITAAKT